MKNYTYISIMVLLSFAPWIQAMDKAKPIMEEPISKEDLLGVRFFVDIDDAKSCIVSDTSSSSVEDEEALGEALLKQKRLQSAGKARLQSAFLINRAHAGLIKTSESHMLDTEIHSNPLADSMPSLIQERAAMPILALHEFVGVAPTLYFTHSDELLSDAEAGVSFGVASEKVFGHHRSLPLSGNEVYDSAGFPILIARRLAQPLPTVPEVDEDDSLSALIAEISFSERGLKSK